MDLKMNMNNSMNGMQNMQNPMNNNMQGMAMGPGMMQMPMMNNQMPNQAMGYMNPMQNQTPQKKDVNEKYKTERCRHYETHKNCILGDKCHFAHGDAELRKPEDPLTEKQLMMAQKAQQWQNCNQQGAGRFNKQKNYYNQNDQQNHRGGMQGGRGRGGFNNRGMRGGFNRGHDRGGRGGGFNQGFNRSQGNSGSQNYKTVKCKFWEQNGSCKFGQSCVFAHGEHELRKHDDKGMNPQDTGMQNNAQDMMKQNPQFNMAQQNMQQMGQFPGMMMPQQMGFPTGMYPDPNMQNMQMMMFANAAAQNQDGQQFPPGMMQNPYIQMQNQMMAKPNPLNLAFKHEGITKHLLLNQMDYSVETNQKIQAAINMITNKSARNTDIDQGLQILSQLQNQKKILFNVQFDQMENAENGGQDLN